MQRVVFLFILLTGALFAILFLSSIAVMIVSVLTANLKGILSSMLVFVFCSLVVWLIFKSQMPCAKREGRGMEKYGVEFDELVKQLIEEGLSEQEAIEKAKEILKLRDESLGS
ncbi:MAG: hypothetical protein QXE80_03660 [Pyrobaculum sp.]